MLRYAVGTFSFFHPKKKRLIIYQTPNYNNQNVPYLYLLLNLFTLSYPLFMSWDKRINYQKKWKYFFRALPIMMVVMIIWDIAFTRIGVWGFNENYTLGWYVVGLPIEEWMFFVVVPFSCVFIYEVVVYFDTRNKYEKLGKAINLVVLVVVLFLLYIGIHQMYTIVAMGFLSVLLLFHQFMYNAKYLGRFYISFLFVLLPFVVMNGVLTGSFIQGEVVWYNDVDIFNFRFFTIPVEDVFYCMFMLLFLITFYELFKKKEYEN